MPDPLTCYLWLTIGFSPANPRKWDLLAGFDSVESFYKNLKQCSLPLTLSERQSLGSAQLEQAEKMLDHCRTKGINVYCYEDSAYPEKLKRTANPPSVLFSYGRLEDIDFSTAAAVVGSRNADEYSLSCTEKLSAELAQNGVVIISGMAAGIDTAAHMGALSAGGTTVAVLGCGLEYDYPRNSSGLKAKISKSGAVISEFFPTAKPCPENFKIRNRICAGLSDCVLCTQASAKSGALNTVSHAAEQGKDIFVTPPHDIFSPDYQGIIALLRDGAQEIYCAEDILRQI